MKKLFLFLLFSSFLITCKKDKSSSVKTTVLSKIYENDVVIQEFIYSGKKLAEARSYDEGTGLLSYSSKYEYNNAGQLLKENQFTKNNKLTGQLIYTYDNDGHFQMGEYKSLSGTDSGEIVSRIKYSYDVSGRVGKESWVNIVTDKVESSQEITYYDNGNIKSSAVYYYLPAKTLQWKTEYKPEGKPLPAHFDDATLKGGPFNYYLYDMVMGEKHFYQYSGMLVTGETNTVFSNREYDDKDYLTKQSYSVNKIIPVALSPMVKMKYEYAEL